MNDEAIKTLASRESVRNCIIQCLCERLHSTFGPSTGTLTCQWTYFHCWDNNKASGVNVSLPTSLASCQTRQLSMPLSTSTRCKPDTRVVEMNLN